MPPVGKSLTPGVIGATRYGRRVIEIDHDRWRSHSPIIDQMGGMVIIESKSIGEYQAQANDMGEDTTDLEGVYGYSLGQTEPRMPSFEYPEYEFQTTEEITNLQL